MDSFTRQVREARYDVCKGCQLEYTKEEVVEEGKKCDFCQHIEETASVVAGLQD